MTQRELFRTWLYNCRKTVTERKNLGVFGLGTAHYTVNGLLMHKESVKATHFDSMTQLRV